MANALQPILSALLKSLETGEQAHTHTSPAAKERASKTEQLLRALAPWEAQARRKNRKVGLEFGLRGREELSDLDAQSFAWTSATQLSIRGLAFNDSVTPSPWNRLPRAAQVRRTQAPVLKNTRHALTHSFGSTKSATHAHTHCPGVVRSPVWNLGLNSAGLTVSFASDSPFIAINYSVASKFERMVHFPMTGDFRADRVRVVVMLCG
jgi:hypothetical protein